MDVAQRVARLLPLVAPQPLESSKLDAAETALGRPFPTEYRAWMLAAGPDAAADYDLFLDQPSPTPGDPDPLGAVSTQGDEFRALGWGLPDELVPVGGNGGDEMIGLWMPRDRIEPPVVVGFDMGLDHGDRSLWILGTSWLSFVEGWMLAYADTVGPDAVWAALDVPEALRIDDPDDDQATAMLRFTSPGWPEVTWMWGELAHDVADLRALLRERATP